MSSTVEFESPVSASRLFTAALVDWHNLGPKAAPEFIASATPIQGHGEVGSIRQINFTSAVPFDYVKEQLDFIDLDKFELKSSIIEGGHIGKKLETASTHFKFEPLGNGGCKIKVVATYKTLPGADATEEVEKAKEAMIGSIKAAEAHLLANPDAYV